MAADVSMQELVALATSGDADARYALSSALHRHGRFDESLHWLRLAAAQGLVPARMTLAVFLIDGRLCPRDLQQARDLLEPLAATQAQANVLLGELHGFAALGIDDRETGLRHLLAAAHMGDPGALRQLALLAVCHGRWDLVRPLLDAAARGGDAAATYALACCHAEGIGGEPDPALALYLCRSEAARSQYLHQRLARQLEGRGATASVRAPPALAVDWPLLDQALPQLTADIPLPAAEVLNATPLVRRLPGAIHPLVVDWLVDLAAPLVRRSQIVDAATGEVREDPVRTSSHITFGPRQHDHVVEAIERCIARVAGLPVLNAEFLQVLRYLPGEQFRPHVDYFNEGGAGAYASMADGGQRAQTVLTYLNDDHEGGSTSFPKLGLDIRARRGDILHFHNLGADGLGDRDSLHAGLPVTAGEKWLLSQWIRSESYVPRMAW